MAQNPSNSSSLKQLAFMGLKLLQLHTRFRWSFFPETECSRCIQLTEVLWVEQWQFNTQRSRYTKLQQKYKAFIDIKLRPGIATPFMAVAARCNLHLSASRPLRPNVTSSIKPEVHSVAQSRWRRTQPQPQGIRTRNFVKIVLAIPEICSRTDWRTDRRVDHNTPHPYRSGVVVKSIQAIHATLNCRRTLATMNITNTRRRLSLMQMLPLLLWRYSR